MTPEPGVVGHDGESDRQVWELRRGEPPLAALRDWIANLLQGLAADVIYDVQLICTELVSNAYEHGYLPGQVRVNRPAQREVIRIEVDDDSSRQLTMSEPSTTTIRGRGLQLVEALASRWGVTYTRWGKTVWAEVSVGCASTAPR